MDDDESLAVRFEEHRSRLRAMAHRMLGSWSAADDALEEAWLWLSRTGTDGIEDLGGRLTATVGRICLGISRSHGSRAAARPDARVPDPVLTSADATGPEQADATGPEQTDSAGARQKAMSGDPAGPALLVGLDSLAPTERLAFVLHDLFTVPFEEIASIAETTPEAARRLAGRARRRMQGAYAAPKTDPARQQQVVEAFLAAARDGDFDALVAVLDPDVVLRADTGATSAGPDAGPSREIRGAAAVAGQALAFQRFAAFARPALVRGAAGLVTAPDGRRMSAMSFTIQDEMIVEIGILADPDRLDGLAPVIHPEPEA